MKALRMAIAALALTGVAGAAIAAPRQVTIPIDFTCPVSDPQLFEFVLKRQPGVLSVEVFFDEQWVVVIYDDLLTGQQELIDALIDVGLGEMLGSDPITEGPAPEAKP